MNTGTRLGSFVLAMAVLLGGGYAFGRIAGAADDLAGDASGHASSENADHAAGGADHTKDDGGTELPGGLLVSDRGYTLQPVDGPDREFAFRITGPDGKPVTRYEVEHDKRMHLIVVRRDLAGFRHVHPELGADGTWRVASPLGDPGSYRAYADFTPTGGKALTLGVDLAVPGRFSPRPLPEPATTTTVDGYTVVVDGALRPGRTSKLTLSVSREGEPVTDLQPYLGAYGHLVALRVGDLAYLHVHPDGEPDDGKTEAGPSITFYAEVPSAGSYRLYLDFKRAGKVRTAAFTVIAGGTAAPAPTGSTGSDHGGDAGHGHAD